MGPASWKRPISLQKLPQRNAKGKGGAKKLGLRVNWVTAPGVPLTVLSHCRLQLLLGEREAIRMALPQQNRTSLSWRAKTKAMELTHGPTAKPLRAQVGKGFQHSLVVLLTPLH